MRISVVYAAPGVEAHEDVVIPADAVVADAVEASGLLDRFLLRSSDIALAIFGQRARSDTPLRDGDRIEILRPLPADPKELRRRRAARSRANNRAKTTRG